jgi:orotate phosphoribosyltransferase
MPVNQTESAADKLAVTAAQILRDSKAIIEDDHFVYISGDHGSGWIDKDTIYPYTERISELAKLLAEVVRNMKAEIVCGPATGGLVLSQWLAYHLGVLSTFAEHDTESGAIHQNHLTPGRFILRRNYDRLVAGKRVLVVDDIVNTGHSIKQTVEAVKRAGGNVIGAAAICTRGNASGESQIGSDNFQYLLEYKIPAWPAASCELCRTGVPVNIHYAHGLEFVQAV